MADNMGTSAGDDLSMVIEALLRLQDKTGLSKIGILHRAIILYEFIDAELGMGREMLIRDKNTGETRTVMLF